MNQLHPIFQQALAPLFRRQRTDGPWEYDADARQVVCPHVGYLPDDQPLAELPDLGGEERGNGYRMAAANEMHAALMLFMEAGVGNSTDYRKQAQAHAAATRALAKADGIV